MCAQPPKRHRRQKSQGCCLGDPSCRSELSEVNLVWSLIWLWDQASVVALRFKHIRSTFSDSRKRMPKCGLLWSVCVCTANCSVCADRGRACNRHCVRLTTQIHAVIVLRDAGRVPLSVLHFQFSSLLQLSFRSTCVPFRFLVFDVLGVLLSV